MEISDVPESVTDKDLEGRVLNLFEKTDVEVNADNIEAFYWIKSNAWSKNVTAQSCR